MLDVARSDHWAASGVGPLHRASPAAKIAFVLMVVLSAVLTKNPFSLVVGYALILTVAGMSGLPWVRVMVLSWYAAVFAVLYSLSLHASLALRLLTIEKAIVPSCAMLMLIISTPYPRIFSLLGRFLPETLAAGLFMTYRTMFVLLDMMHNFYAAIRLRGGFSPGSIFKNSANISKGIAMLLVRAVERSTHTYEVMLVRGYNGSMAEPGALRLKRGDWLPLGTGASVLALVLFWKS